MSNEERELRKQSLKNKLERCRDDLADLQGKTAFSDVVEEVTSASASLPGLKEGLQKLRSRGYAFRGDLEEKLASAAAEIEPVLAKIRQEIDAVDDRLSRDVKSLSRDAGRITGQYIRNESQIDALESRVKGLKSEISSIEDRLEAHSESLLASVKELTDKIKDINWTLDQFDSATFKMAPEERPIAAAKATWEDDPEKEKPTGLLMFTDHRVRFEQNEERVTKRKFFVFAAEKESLHELLIDEPVGHLEDSQDSTRGWVMKDQLLTFSWSRKARCPSTTTFEVLSGSAADWDGVVELIKSGDLSDYEASTAAASRAPDIAGGAPAAAAAHKVKWPEQCISCNAPLDAPVKGQTALVCGYCGTNHAVEYLS